jgi:predicted nucleotidyltransferase
LQQENVDVNSHSEFIADVIEWVATEPELLGVALVGPYARGAERADSDIDLLMVTRNPVRWETNEWYQQFGKVLTVELEDYGPVQSRRIHYESGIEVEFGITTPEWLGSAPVDEGTRRVMSEGHRILDDKAGLFSAFLAVLRKDQPNQEELGVDRIQGLGNM